MPVPAETGASDGDLDEQYLTARYCVVLNEAEYNRVAAYIRRLQMTTKEWHAPTKNCNYFLGEIAEYMRLKAPPSPLLYPESYVNMLRDMNESTGSIGAFMPSIPYGQFGMPQSEPLNFGDAAAETLNFTRAQAPAGTRPAGPPISAITYKR